MYNSDMNVNKKYCSGIFVWKILSIIAFVMNPRHCTALRQTSWRRKAQLPLLFIFADRSDRLTNVIENLEVKVAYASGVRKESLDVNYLSFM